MLSRFAKRAMDLSLSLMALLITLPLWAIVAIAIKLGSRGPIMFKQERVGKDGKIFNMYKFRTMYEDADTYELAPQQGNDPRITPVGRFLRRTSLDELPNLISVVKGDMSLVGPRPEMPFIVETYKDWQKLRLRVKPGVTGLWQVAGRKDLLLHENLEFDFYYIEKQSLLLDLIILLKTVFVVIGGKGAY